MLTSCPSRFCLNKTQKKKKRRDTRAATRTSGSDQVEEEQAKVVGLRVVPLSEQQQHQQ